MPARSCKLPAHYLFDLLRHKRLHRLDHERLQYIMLLWLDILYIFGHLRLR